jgi:hypothetical protein
MSANFSLLWSFYAEKLQKVTIINSFFVYLLSDLQSL